MVIRMLLLVAVVVLGACDTGPKSGAGFRLPDGDVEQGRAVFVALQCTSCHKIDGLDLPPADVQAVNQVVLGGSVTRIKNYGELVSSIINPSHKLTKNYPKQQVSVDGVSLMSIYNEEMTVQQLVDLVAFLQPQYQVVVPDYTYHRF